jgi:hypothetical protein
MWHRLATSAFYEDNDVVVDGNLVSSREEAFTSAF